MAIEAEGGGGWGAEDRGVKLDSAILGRHLDGLELPSQESGELPADQRMGVAVVRQTCSVAPALEEVGTTCGRLQTLGD